MWLMGGKGGGGGGCILCGSVSGKGALLLLILGMYMGAPFQAACVGGGAVTGEVAVLSCWGQSCRQAA